jgi:hypothetical protein
MAWENRKGKLYYTRSRRVRGKVVREYFGRGEAAEKAAAEDEERREATRRAARRFRERERQDTPLLECIAILDALLHHVMTERGYHNPHGTRWYRKRLPRTESRSAANAAHASTPPPVSPPAGLPLRPSAVDLPPLDRPEIAEKYPRAGKVTHHRPASPPYRSHRKLRRPARRPDRGVPRSPTHQPRGGAATRIGAFILPERPNTRSSGATRVFSPRSRTPLKE